MFASVGRTVCVLFACLLSDWLHTRQVSCKGHKCSIECRFVVLCSFDAVCDCCVSALHRVNASGTGCETKIITVWWQRWHWDSGMFAYSTYIQRDTYVTKRYTKAITNWETWRGCLLFSWSEIRAVYRLFTLKPKLCWDILLFQAHVLFYMYCMLLC